jgi:hypothetical protein
MSRHVRTCYCIEGNWRVLIFNTTEVIERHARASRNILFTKYELI